MCLVILYIFCSKDQFDSEYKKLVDSLPDTLAEEEERVCVHSIITS